VLGVREPLHKLLAIHINHVSAIIIVTASKKAIATLALRVHVFFSQNVIAVCPRYEVTAVHCFPVIYAPTSDALA
jgi:malic enzyme